MTISIPFGRDTLFISRYSENEADGKIVVHEAYTDTWIKKIYQHHSLLLMLSTKKKYQALLKTAIQNKVVEV